MRSNGSSSGARRRPRRRPHRPHQGARARRAGATDARARLLGATRRLRRRRRGLPYVQSHGENLPGRAAQNERHVGSPRRARRRRDAARAGDARAALGGGAGGGRERRDGRVRRRHRRMPRAGRDGSGGERSGARHARVRQPSRIADPVPRAAEELLAAHPRRFALRHAISRDDVPTAADGTPTAVGVERRTRGRVDAAVIAAEFGSWAASRRISSSSAPARWNATRGPGLQSRSAGAEAPASGRAVEAAGANAMNGMP